MDFRDLEYFVAVAEELHFGHAATRLSIVPAAVSQRIRGLETELGVRLFDRTSRTVTLTQAGRTLLNPARSALHGVGSVAALGRSLANGASGQARISLAPHLGPIAARFVARLVSELPDLEAVGHSLWGMQGLDAVASSKVDVAILRGPVAREGIEAVTIGSYRESSIAVSRHDAIADGLGPVRLEQFEGAPVFLPDRDLAPLVHDRTRAYFAENGVAPLWRHHRLQSYEQMTTFIAAGYAAGLMHDIRSEREFPGVVVVPIVEPGPVYEIVVGWRSGDDAPAVTRVAALARSMADAQPGAGTDG